MNSNFKNTLLVLLLLTGMMGYSQNWLNNLEEAKTKASQENKNILLVFSGSDWCGPCIKLDKTVWQSEQFQKEAPKNWILVKADFPKKKAHQLTPELTESNNKLAEKYNKEGNFPLVILLDKTGKVKGMLGYMNVDAEEYIENIHDLDKK
jgi:thioredoxin-related protein